MIASASTIICFSLIFVCELLFNHAEGGVGKFSVNLLRIPVIVRLWEKLREKYLITILNHIIYQVKF